MAESGEAVDFRTVGSAGAEAVHGDELTQVLDEQAIAGGMVGQDIGHVDLRARKRNDPYFEDHLQVGVISRSRRRLMANPIAHVAVYKL